jgi:hypothetical protein
VFAAYNDSLSGAAPTVARMPGLGFHYAQAMEVAFGGGTASFYGDNGGLIQTGLSITGMF